MCDIVKCKTECNSISRGDGIDDVWDICKNCPVAGSIYKCNYKTIPKKIECPAKCKEQKCSKLDSIKEVLYDCGSCTGSAESDGCYNKSNEFNKIEEEFKHRVKLVNEELIYEKYKSCGTLPQSTVNNSSSNINPTSKTMGEMRMVPTESGPPPPPPPPLPPGTPD